MLLPPKTREKNQVLVDENLENLKLFLNSNSLCINESKTCLIETMNVQKHCKTSGRPPSILAKNEQGIVVDKQADNSCRLLGANFSQNLTWRAHLLSGEKPLIPALRKQVGRLKFICKNVPFRSRKTLAEGIVLSRVKYLIAMWGGTTANLHRKIQVILNSAARWRNWPRQKNILEKTAVNDWMDDGEGDD